jgi:CRISPR-associated protein Csd1
MSWVEKLYQTYEANKKSIGNPNEDIPLLPLYHTMQNSQVHIVLDDNGSFLRASVVPKDYAPTIIPATEESAGRSGSKIAPHPLCDTLQYIAGDYLKWGGNPHKKKNESGYVQYLNVLWRWIEWSKNKKLQSVYSYLQRGTLIADLIEQSLLYGDSNGHLMEVWHGPELNMPPIFKIVKQANKRGQFEVFVRFSVEMPGDPQSELWKDAALQKSWSDYYAEIQTKRGLCMVIGEDHALASNHPKNIRYPGDGAKIVSSNDQDGFTFLGRFKSADEAFGLSLEVTHKAHNSLRWLIGRQSFRNGEQVVISWALSGAQLPDLFKNSCALFGELLEDGSYDLNAAPKDQSIISDMGQTFALRLKKKIAGYNTQLGSTEGIMVMGLDSATPGRMATTYYREIKGSEFLERVEDWHESLAWPMRFTVHDTSPRKIRSKTIWVACAPAPTEIAEVCYGRRMDEKLKKATIERLLPCIVDGMPIPLDLVESAVRRAANREGQNRWEWERSLGIGCALYKGFYRRNVKEKRSYAMALELDRNSRDYLYGRLLAIAEHIEERALYVADEKRDTTAAKLMQRFADRPFSTWKTIELSLVPYKTRLLAKRSGFLHEMKTLLNDVHSRFTPGDYQNDSRLTGEFLLGYHCQQQKLWKKKTNGETDTENTTSEGE